MISDDFKFQCPTCRAVIKAVAPYAGKKIPCPRCGQRLAVPNPTKLKTVLGEVVESERPPRAEPQPAGGVFDFHSHPTRDDQTQKPMKTKWGGPFIAAAAVLILFLGIVWWMRTPAGSVLFVPSPGNSDFEQQVRRYILASAVNPSTVTFERFGPNMSGAEIIAAGKKREAVSSKKDEADRKKVEMSETAERKEFERELAEYQVALKKYHDERKRVLFEAKQVPGQVLFEEDPPLEPRRDFIPSIRKHVMPPDPFVAGYSVKYAEAFTAAKVAMIRVRYHSDGNHFDIVFLVQGIVVSPVMLSIGSDEWKQNYLNKTGSE